MNTRERAFTLVELLIVIIIIAVLAAVVVPKFGNSSVRARESSLKAHLRNARNAIERFKANTNVFPMTLNDLAAKNPPAKGLNPQGVQVAINPSSYEGPYMEVVPTDPMSGNAFNYEVTSPNVGKVKSSASGAASDGTLYSTW